MTNPHTVPRVSPRRAVHAAFDQFLEAMKQVGRMMPATVKSETDPQFPGRTVYHIEAPTKLAVEVEIARLRETVDVFGGVPGRAIFIGPARVESGYVAVGEIVKE